MGRGGVVFCLQCTLHKSVREGNLDEMKVDPGELSSLLKGVHRGLLPISVIG